MKKRGMYFLMIVGIFFGLIGIEVLMRGIGNFFSNHRKNIQMQQEEKAYQNSEEYQTNTFLESSVRQIIDLLKAKDDTSLYAILDEDFINYRELKDVNSFQSYMKQYIPSFLDARMISWKQYDDLFVCLVSITGETGTFTRNFVIKKAYDNSFTVIFDAAKSIRNVSNLYYQGNGLFHCKIQYIIETESTIVYVIDITNNSKTTMDGSFEKTVLRKSNGDRCSVLSDLSNEIIEPSQTKRLLFEMDNLTGKEFSATGIDIIFQNQEESSQSELSINLQDRII